MIDLLPVLAGAALMLVAALRVASGKDLVRGDVHPVHVRFILTGLMLTSSPGTVPLLGSALASVTGPSWHSLCLAVAAAAVATSLGVLLPQDPEDYRRLIHGRPAELEAR